jgi:hypothetical protein
MFFLFAGRQIAGFAKGWVDLVLVEVESNRTACSRVHARGPLMQQGKLALNDF